jgi:predicted esterase
VVRQRLLRFALDRLGITALIGRRYEQDALDARPRLPRFALTVVEADESGVTLAAARPGSAHHDLLHDGVFGLAWPGGYRQVGPPTARGSRAWRAFLCEGPIPRAGAMARIDTFAFAPDPRARGFDFEDITIPGPLGRYPAWVIPGRSDTWVIAVHGKGASRREFLRALRPFAAAGMPALAITYRNDRGAPRAPDGRYGYGAEWPDIEAAVRWALDRGAQRIAFNGYSMGAAICLAFLRHSSLARHVAGLALDSPMLDFRATVAFGARRAGFPPFIVPPLMESFRERYGTDWESLTYYEELVAFTGPITLAHGADDTIIPVATSDHAARLLGGRAPYLRTERTGHVRSWNVAPERYEEALRAFIHELGC